MESSDPYDFAAAESGGCEVTIGVKDHELPHSMEL